LNFCRFRCIQYSVCAQGKNWTRFQLANAQKCG
jgi:hypothetical protein